MATSVPPINYTNRDFFAIKEAFRTHLQEKFPDSWRDFYESNLGIAITDLIGIAFDTLSFQLDYTANELFLETARDKESVLRLGELVGYNLRTPTSASVQCVGTLAALYGEAIVVPKGTIVSSKAGVAFYTVEDQQILAGQLQRDIVFVQGREETASFTSDGTNFQKFLLPVSPVVQDTIEIKVDGDTWTQYDSLAYADADTKAFAMWYNVDGQGYILFGNNESGKLPSNGSTIAVTYRIGGGVSGNIALNEINTTIAGYRYGILPIQNVSVAVINNEERGSGGEDAETTTHAKLWIPYWVKANGRAVTESDWDVLANAFSDSTYGAPAHAKAMLKQNIPELNTVEVALWGRNSEGIITTASTGLKQAIEDYFNNDGVGSVRMICTHAEVVDGEILYVDIKAKSGLISTFSEAQLLQNIEKAISGIFSSGVIVPGQDFRISWLYDTMQGVEGVVYTIVEEISLSKRMTNLVSFGYGYAGGYFHTFELDPGSYVIPKSCKFWYGDDVEVLTDDGNGNIINSTNVVVGSIDYDTGVCSFTFANVLGVDTAVYGWCRYVIDYQRGETEKTADGITSRFQGEIEFPPINPFDTVIYQKGIAFSDGIQTVLDDGNGSIIGDVDPLGKNKIDYTSGAYDFTFANIPPIGASISSTYRQLLVTASQDLPVDKNQICIEGIITVTAVE